MNSTHSLPEATSSTASFEVQLQSLSSVVQQLKQGQLPLQESLSLYEQGVALVRRCQSELQSTEGTFKQLQEALSQPEMPSCKEAPPLSTDEAVVLSLPTELGMRIHHRLRLSKALDDEAPLKALLMALKTIGGGLNTQELPKLYKRSNQTGFEAHLPLELGFIHVSIIQGSLLDTSALLLLDVALLGTPLTIQKSDVLERLEQWCLQYSLN